MSSATKMMFAASGSPGGSPVADSIVAFWDFESASQTADSAGSNTLTEVGDVDVVAGKIGNAAGGFSNSDYFSRTGAVGPIGTNARTYAGWFKTTSTATSTAIILSIGVGSAAGTRFIISVENGVFWIRTLGGRVASYSSGLNNDDWHSFVVAMNSGDNLSQIDVYLDNSIVIGSVSSDGAINTATGDTGVGGKPPTVAAPVEPFTGSLDQIIVANRAWDSTDANYFYGVSGAGRPTAQLLTP